MQAPSCSVIHAPPYASTTISSPFTDKPETWSMTQMNHHRFNPSLFSRNTHCNDTPNSGNNNGEDHGGSIAIPATVAHASTTKSNCMHSCHMVNNDTTVIPVSHLPRTAKHIMSSTATKHVSHESTTNAIPTTTQHTADATNFVDHIANQPTCTIRNPSSSCRVPECNTLSVHNIPSLPLQRTSLCTSSLPVSSSCANDDNPASLIAKKKMELIANQAQCKQQNAKMRIWFRCINLILFAIIVFVLIDVIRRLREESHAQSNTSSAALPELSLRDERIRIILAGMHAIAILAWPIVWDLLIGYEAIFQFPLLILGLLWPIVLIYIDLRITATLSRDERTRSFFGINAVQTDATALITIAFAIGTLVAGKYMGILAPAAIPILFYALLICIAFVVPTPAIDPDSDAGYIYGDLQRIAFEYAMGLVIAGISVNIMSKILG